MAYRLEMSSKPGRGLRTCAAEQLGDARDGLAAADAETEAEAVHDARKRLKKTRSLLRLARPAVGEDRYRPANAQLGQAGRTLSSTRDAVVLVAVVDHLRQRYDGELPAAAFTVLRDALRTGDAAPGPPAAEDPITAALGHLDAAIEDLESWPLDEATWATVLDGLTRSYTRGRRTFRDMGPDASFEARHEWRKRVKDLWYQQRLIAEAWPPVIEAEAEEAHLLSEFLGDDHDHAVLHEAITGGRVDAGPDAAEVLALVDRRREELFHDARLLGRRVYAESPKAFRKRHAAYLGAWADAHRASPGED